MILEMQPAWDAFRKGDVHRMVCMFVEGRLKNTEQAIETLMEIAFNAGGTAVLKHVNEELAALRRDVQERKQPPGKEENT